MSDEESHSLSVSRLADVAYRMGQSTGTVAQERVTKLEEGIRAYLERNHSNPRDFRPGTCEHGTNYWEECAQCDIAHFEKLLEVPR